MATAVRQAVYPQRKITKKILVTVNTVKGKGATVSVKPDPVHLKISKGHQVMWCCDQGHLEIRFKRDTPFHGHHWKSPMRGGCCSGVPRPGTDREKPYKYAVKVATNGHTYTRDPDVKVDH